MLPISEIKEGDYFSNPMFVNHPLPGLIYRVEQIERKEKMVKVQPYSAKSFEPFGKPFWKKNTDRMFSESWRYGK